MNKDNQKFWYRLTEDKRSYVDRNTGIVLSQDEFWDKYKNDPSNDVIATKPIIYYPDIYDFRDRLLDLGCMRPIIPTPKLEEEIGQTLPWTFQGRHEHVTNPVRNYHQDSITFTVADSAVIITCRTPEGKLLFQRTKSNKRIANCVEVEHKVHPFIKKHWGAISDDAFESWKEFHFSLSLFYSHFIERVAQNDAQGTEFYCSVLRYLLDSLMGMKYQIPFDAALSQLERNAREYAELHEKFVDEKRRIQRLLDINCSLHKEIGRLRKEQKRLRKLCYSRRSYQKSTKR
jgi:hypothetical protein